MPNRGLKKAQGSGFHMEKERKDTEKEINDLTAKQRNLKDKAIDIIKNTNAAEIFPRDPEGTLSSALRPKSHSRSKRCA